MSGLGGSVENTLLPSQVAIHELYDELISAYPLPITQFDQKLRDVVAQDVRQLLANTTMADMLVQPGEKLAPDPRYDDYPGVYPGVDATLTEVSIGAFGTLLPKTLYRCRQARRAQWRARGRDR